MRGNLLQDRVIRTDKAGRTPIDAAAAAGCPDCRGGGEINGVPCRCQGRKRGQQPAKNRAGRVLHGWSLRAAVAAGTVVRWSRSVPGIAGAAGVTIGSAMIVHAIWHRVPVLAVGLVVAGVFGLLADMRL